jgi:DNA-binding CsgD family transcriptional regulator
LRPCRLFIALALLLPALGYCQFAKLSGKVSLDSGWSRKVYISRIPGFDYMYTISNSLIIAQGDIDTAGNFLINFPASTDESLFRLHFIRKGDPASTLIIGSQDVNHVFLIAKQGDQINFEKKAHNAITQSGIGGSKANAELNNLLEQAASDTTGNNTFISIAASSTSPLVGLLAISHTDNLSEAQKEKISELLSHIDPHNGYGAHIFQEYRTSNYWKLLIAGSILLFVAFLLYGYRYFKRLSVLKIWRGLSQREMDIVGLILSGKSNKEVAQALTIELSTVKTHVNNIYAKLKVNNRKDLDRYKDFISTRPLSQ